MQAPSYEYKVTFTPTRRLARFAFSITEVKHLTISAILIIGVGLSIMFSSLGTGLFELAPAVLVAASAMFVAIFLLHEIAHKMVAQYYGLWAEFRLILLGVFFTLLSLIPLSLFKIIAPGAVMIAGPADRKIIGKTAVAGPLTNIILAIISLPIAFFIPLAYLSVAFNAWIALLNILPVAILDGLKVFQWSKIVWAAVFIAALALAVVTLVYFYA